MVEGQPEGVQCDRRAIVGQEGQPRPIAAVAHDRTAVTGKLRPQLMPAARGRLEFDQRNLAGTVHHASPHVTRPAALVVDAAVAGVVGKIVQDVVLNLLFLAG